MRYVRRSLRSWFVVPTFMLSACGLELGLVGTPADGADGGGASSSSSSSSSGAEPSSGSSSSSSSGNEPDATVTDGAPSGDAEPPPDDADSGDAAPIELVCVPRETKGAFCADDDAVTCLAGSNDDPPWIPSGNSTVGSVYFDDPIDTAPFSIALRLRFARVSGDDRHGAAAVFFGGDPAATTDLCARLQALAPGEAAVLYSRQVSGTTSARIVTVGEGCGDPSVVPYRGDDADRDVTIAYDGTNLTISGEELAAPVTKQVALNPQLRLGLVGQRYAGDGPPLRVEHITLTCPSD